MPSAKYCCAGSGLRLRNGSTTTDGRSVADLRLGLGAVGYAGPSLDRGSRARVVSLKLDANGVTALGDLETDRVSAARAVVVLA